MHADDRKALEHSVSFGLNKGIRGVRGLRRELSEDRREIAKAIVSHLLDVCKFRLEPGDACQQHATPANWTPT